MLGPYPRHRHHAEAVSDNEQEMSTISMHVEDTRSQTSRTLETRPGREETDRPSSLLRVIKWIALGLIALCVCGGGVLSKVSLVSITGRFFDLTSQDDPDGHEDGRLSRSKLFVQLTLTLILPEVISFVTCLVQGVIGKTTKTFPWPKLRWALVWVSQPTLCMYHITRVDMC